MFLVQPDKEWFQLQYIKKKLKPIPAQIAVFLSRFIYERKNIQYKGYKTYACMHVPVSCRTTQPALETSRRAG